MSEVGASGVTGQAEAERSERPPNVVIIVVDDMGWTDVGCYGSTYYETPNVDRLCREGMKFTQGYAACAVCSPSRAALLTGRYPARLGVTDWIHHASKVAREAVAKREHIEGFDPPRNRMLLTPINKAWLDHSEVTIAELLKPLGYTSCHVGKWHLGPEGWLPRDQGFDVNRGGFQVGQPPSYFDPYANRRFPGIHDLPSRKKGEYLTDREADEAVAFIEKHRDRPFFLHMAHYAVHSPLQAKKELIEKYRAKEKSHQNVPVYAAMVESVDDAVGKILACLDEHGIADDTIVVFTSDNGGASHFRATNNKPLRKGKGFPYEGGIRVPFIVRWPKVVKAGSVCDVPVCGIDLFPTIAEATSAKFPESPGRAAHDPDGRVIDGRSLIPLLRGRGAIERDTLYWHFPHYWWGTRIQPYSIIREGDWKLIYRYDGDRVELYDLAEDPGEKNDLAAKKSERAQRLKDKLMTTLRSQGARFPQTNADFDKKR